MTKKIDPDLFARLMKLSSRTRTDLLEYFGQTPVSAAEVARLSAIDSYPRGHASATHRSPD